MTPEIQAIHAQEITNMIHVLKVIGMWLGVAFIIHYVHVRAYMLAWLASGHQTSFNVRWHDFLFEIGISLATLALWLDHYNVL
jgi:hypothetical protein